MSEALEETPQLTPAQFREREHAAWLGLALVNPEVELSEETHNWQQQRACVGEDPELFFPDRTDGARITDAKRICQTCVVRTKCLEEALVGGIEFGIWGGLTEHERRKIKRRSI